MAKEEPAIVAPETRKPRGKLKNGAVPGPGRAAGVPNRSTATVKEAVMLALLDPRGGSAKEFFIKLKTGTAEDRRCFATIAARLVPQEVSAKLDHRVSVTVKQSARPIESTPDSTIPRQSKTYDAIPLLVSTNDSETTADNGGLSEEISAEAVASAIERAGENPCQDGGHPDGGCADGSLQLSAPPP